MVEHELIQSLGEDEDINGQPIVQYMGDVSKVGVCPWATSYLRSTDKCFAVSDCRVIYLTYYKNAILLQDPPVFLFGDPIFVDLKRNVFKRTSVEVGCDNAHVFNVSDIYFP